MTRSGALSLLFLVLALSITTQITAESPYDIYTWTVTYGKIAPIGKAQRGILINGLFPGPQMDVVTNDNVYVNVINKLDEPFLITWHGLKQRKMSWQDGVLGTNCPIPPGSNFTYKMQAKDQIGSYMYYPSTAMHKAAGGFGSLNIHRRSVIPLPYHEPKGEFSLLVGDWRGSDHKKLQKKLDAGKDIKLPSALLINGRHQNTVFTGQHGETYLVRVANVGLTTSINIRIQGHRLQLVEVEGSHVLQEIYESLDVHVGQSLAFLVRLQARQRDYYIVASTRFTKKVLTATAILHYAGSKTRPSGPLPAGPKSGAHWSMKQARTIRWNLTANAARPNPQGAFHYGTIPITRTLILANSKAKINRKTRYAVNGVSYVNPTTPLKLADYYNIPNVFNLNTIPDKPQRGGARLGTSVFGFALHDYIEIIFQNNEKTIQSWHLDGNDCWVVGFGSKTWTAASRKKYNVADGTSRFTFQVYPKSWSAIYCSMDNKGMWNLRSMLWPRRYLGQEVYMRNWNDEKSLFTENDIPDNAIKCGKAAHL